MTIRIGIVGGICDSPTGTNKTSLNQTTGSKSSVLNEAFEFLGERKSALDYLGKARTFLEFLRDTGTAASEVTSFLSRARRLMRSL